MKVKMTNTRIAFPKLFQPEAFGDSEPAFSACFIFAPGAKVQAEVEPGKYASKTWEEVFSLVAKEKWGAKADATLKAIKAKGDLCLHDGAEKADYSGFDGNQYVSARNKARPTVLDRDKTTLTQADGKPYAGCYVNASFDVWPQDNGFGKRINASLLGVQFSKDGEAFGGSRVASEDDFDMVEDDEMDLV